MNKLPSARCWNGLTSELHSDINFNNVANNNEDDDYDDDKRCEPEKRRQWNWMNEKMANCQKWNEDKKANKQFS